jgi:glycosyltransferase involved in cell wall biosynthesis
MTFAVDLRALNFETITGVNTAILHFLHQIFLTKKPNWQIICVGLRPEILAKLKTKYTWIQFDKEISLQKYLRFGEFVPHKICELACLCNLGEPLKFDYLFLPQPKFLPSISQNIVYIHDLYHIYEPRSIGWKQSLFFNKTKISKLIKNSIVWANSIATCKDIAKIFLNSKPQLVYLALPNWDILEQKKRPEVFPQSGRTILQSLTKKPYYLAIGGIEPRKNWINLIIAHSILPNLGLELVLIGKIMNPKYLSKLQKLIRELCLKNVKILTNISNLEKENYLQNAQFLIYPSFYEGFGLPILEAFAKKIPVITSRVSSMPEIAKDGAIYCNPFNPKDISSSIWVLSQNLKLQQQLVQNQAKLQDYNWNEFGHKISKLLE